MARKNLSITLDPEVYEVIKDMAEKDQRTVSSMIGLMLKRYMREHPAPRQPVDPAAPVIATAEHPAIAQTME